MFALQVDNWPRGGILSCTAFCYVGEVSVRDV